MLLLLTEALGVEKLDMKLLMHLVLWLLLRLELVVFLLMKDQQIQL